MAIRQYEVKGPIAVIVLAAGAGRRFGGGKQLAPWRGGALIEAALASAFAAPAAGVTLAVGAGGEAVAATAHAFADRSGQGNRLNVVHVPDWELGLSASLKAAVAALPEDTAASFVFLADMPLIPPEVPPALLAALGPDHLAAVPVVGDEIGHPTLIAAPLFPDLLRLQGDQGGRKLLLGLGERLARVPVAGRGVLTDVDTPAALAEAALLAEDR